MNNPKEVIDNYLLNVAKEKAFITEAFIEQEYFKSGYLDIFEFINDHKLIVDSNGNPIKIQRNDYE